MIHKDKIDLYDGTIFELANDVGNLKYDALCIFLKNLSDKLELDSKADSDRGRPKLSFALLEAAKNVEFAAESIDLAWKISEPYMK